MNKVVINNCYGGFGLSEAALQWLKDNAKNESTRALVARVQDKEYGEYEVSQTLARHDKDLVACVEALGDKANGMCADLVVRTIDADRYRISEYDGLETIETPDSTYWTEIK